MLFNGRNDRPEQERHDEVHAGKVPVLIVEIDGDALGRQPPCPAEKAEKRERHRDERKDAEKNLQAAFHGYPPE